MFEGFSSNCICFLEMTLTMLLYRVLWLSILTGVCTGQKITSDRTEVFPEEGVNVSLSCSYSSAYSLQWYVQYPRSAPQFLLLVLHSTGKDPSPGKHPRLMGKLNQEKTQVFLQISSVQVSDSALYYCALESSNDWKIIFGAGIRLTVHSKEGPDTPTFYELEKEKIKACLATDFRLHNESDKTDLFNKTDKTDATRIVGDKLYSKAVIMSEGDTCPYTGSNCEAGPGGDMDPDPKLNFLTLSVLGLRILFLKTIVFNVLMTVRVWMR